MSQQRLSLVIFEETQTMETTVLSVAGKLRLFFKTRVLPRLTRKVFLTLLASQGLSILLCAAGTASQKLVTACKVDIPAFQGFLNYCLLTAVFSAKFVYSGKDFNKVLKERWWKYILVGIIDVEANYMVYKAYQYTSLTSVQLLDCLAIPTVVILSLVVLKARYRLIHFFGIFICVLGMGFLVWADLNGSRGQSPGGSSNELLGDVLVMCGAVLYGVSNVAEEFVVKTSSITEFLGMMSFFASFASAANVYIFELSHLAKATWDYKLVLLLAVNLVSMFSFYILMPVLINRSSATLVNLSLLTADLYSLFVGLYLFDYKFSHLYIVSFVIIVVGVIIFNAFPSPSEVDHEESEGSIAEEERPIIVNQELAE